jgi:glycosyltransferase involved in cell wall biosynthesis
MGTQQRKFSKRNWVMFALWCQMNEPLISVVIPTYNRAHCLERAVDSVLAQTRGRVEVILIDDGSTDGTAQLVARRYGNDSRVKYFPQANAGVTAARNSGLARVAGDYIALLDSDDVWKPWKLQVQLACMEKHPEIGMVWTDMEAIGPDGTVSDPAYLKKMYGCYSQFTMDEIFSSRFPLNQILPDAAEPMKSATLYVGDIFPKMFFGNLVHTSTVLLRRERFEKVKAFNEELKISGEDFDFHLRTTEHGPVGFVNLSSIEYRVGMPDQLTHKKYMVYGAQNCLRTITAAMQRQPERIRFPRSRILHRFADVHAWIGEAMLENGQRTGARKHLLKSLLNNPWQPRTARLWMLSIAPSKLGESARQIYRQAKGHRQTTKSA